MNIQDDKIGKHIHLSKNEDFWKDWELVIMILSYST